MTIAARAVILLTLALTAGCASTPRADAAPAADSLQGAWRSRIQFSSGDFASVHDLEFLYAFAGDNDGGTLTESSNYDGAPPVPPAYGVWRRSGPRRYEARYIFYTTKPPETVDALTKGGGWGPAGRGELTEAITLAPDGQSFTSTLRLELFDGAGKAVAGGGAATGTGRRIGFEH